MSLTSAANHVRTAFAWAIVLILVVASPAGAEEPPPFILEWGSFGTGDGEFKNPDGMDFDSAGNLYVIDAVNNRVQKFDSNGNFILKWGSFGSGDGQFKIPNYLAVDANDNVFVADKGPNNRIQKFTSTGVFITKWPTHHSDPIGIAVDKTTGDVYVSVGGSFISGPHRIEKYDNSGVFLLEWGTNCCGLANGQLNRPNGLAVDANGDVYVVEHQSPPRVEKFDSNGNFILKWGSFGSGDGQFSLTIDIALDSQGNAYVVDLGNDRVQKFTSTGVFLTKWGSFGSGQGQFNDPRGVAVDSSGNVYVADHLNHRIQKFGPVTVAIDIKPQSCPNPLNVKSKGVLPVAILGTDSFDVIDVEILSIRLESVEPLRIVQEDVATPFEPFVGKEDATDCTDEGPDALEDLTLKFNKQEVVAAIGGVSDGDVVVLTLTGELTDGTPFVGEDVVIIKKKGKP